MQYLISDHKQLPDREKAVGYLAFGVSGLLFACLYLLFWEQYHEPDYARWIEVPGKLNGDGTSWKADTKLLIFGVRFTLPGEAKSQVRPVYADVKAFREARVRIGTPVTLTVEPRQDEVIVREVVMLDGRVLYDDSLYHHVVSANNAQALRVMVPLSIISPIALVLAAILWFRNEGACEGEP
ncbi:hypothetical protein [Pseudomonas sp. UFMG81]|uniref:hypothetical protein n=1 Tax=Pseudomonas sp. UFMG81 TaxID=2745936 RepID=UPI00188F4035|nr:hypothetical protein [Pseudomonas sp. UFMG81]